MDQFWYILFAVMFLILFMLHLIKTHFHVNVLKQGLLKTLDKHETN
jgi:hypothetical protein